MSKYVFYDDNDTVTANMEAKTTQCQTSVEKNNNKGASNTYKQYLGL